MGSEQEQRQLLAAAWLSKRDVAKAHGSMIVYVSKKSDARSFVADGRDAGDASTRAAAE